MMNLTPFTHNIGGYEYNPKAARKFLEQFFSMKELKIILHDLGINHENFDATKDMLVVDFLLYIKRHNRVPELINWLREEVASFGYDQDDVTDVFRLQDGEVLRKEIDTKQEVCWVPNVSPPMSATDFKSAMLKVFGNRLQTSDIDRAIAECRQPTALRSSFNCTGIPSHHLVVTTCRQCGAKFLITEIPVQILITQIGKSVERAVLPFLLVD